jgi:hypothetical protein
LVVILLIIQLYFYYKLYKKENFHEKYIDYRVVAETLRVQYFISKAGIEKSVMDFLPWFTNVRIPLIKDVLCELPIKSATKESVKECWVTTQKIYHWNAHNDALAKKEKNDRWEKIAIYSTIIIYSITLIFEISRLLYSPIDMETADSIRSVIKIAVGSSSTITLILANYYGKMSLSSKSQEHLRMYWLYEQIEEKIEKNGESKELLLYLAEQFLIENTLWYSHQKKNEADFSVG